MILRWKWPLAAVFPARRFATAAIERNPGAALSQRYQELIETNAIKEDAGQRSCIERFRALISDLVPYTSAVTGFEVKLADYQERRQKIRNELLAEEKRRADSSVGVEQGYFSKLWQSLGKKEEDTRSPAMKAIADARAREYKLDQLVGLPPPAPVVPKGIYLYGSVGSGKTMIMDLAFQVMEEHKVVPRMRRVHFNDALNELHQRLHKLETARAQLPRHEVKQYAEAVAKHEADTQQAPSVAEDLEATKEKALHQSKLAVRRLRAQLKRKRSLDESSIANAMILAKAARSLICGGRDVSLGWDDGPRTASLLCFDEMQIDDPFTAICLMGVMEALMDFGTVIICTSNTAPWDLNRHGVHESLFKQFSKRLLESCDAVELSAEQDYRLAFAKQDASGAWLASENYLSPLGHETTKAIDQKWQEILKQEGGTSERTVVLSVIFGRSLQVRRAGKTCARFTFDELCGQPLGSTDYSAIADAFKTVVITDVPDFSLQMRDRARRFISLLDELYCARTRLIMSAESPPHSLFKRPGDAPILDLEGLQFETAVEGSRLRTDLMADGSVAPLAAASASLVSATVQQSGQSEQFAFWRAVSRLFELTHPSFGIGTY